MLERAHGLILRTRQFTETSLIVNWLTPQFGRVSTIAKGARRSKSPFRGKLDLFYEADFSFNRSRRSELHTLGEVSLHHSREALRRDLGYLQQASYGAALIEQTTEKDTPLPGIFELFRGFLDALPTAAPQPQMIFSFELKLLTELGLAPDLQESKLTPGSKKICTELVAQDWPALFRLKLSDSQIKEIGQFLQGFLIFHLGRIPKGRSSAII